MPLTRDAVFDRVYVDYAVRGTARVSWLLKPRFVDARPYYFQLQASRIGSADWENVGAPVENEYYALDDTARLAGQDRRLSYRVKLTTPENTYYSEPAQIMGKLSRHQWLLARESMRQLALDFKSARMFDGYLLKRRIQGTKCPVCVDLLTGGITDSDCETCNGTGYVDGYFRAFYAKMYDLSPKPHDTHNRKDTGTITDSGFVAKFVGIPSLHNRDIWIDANSDERYVVDNVQHISELNMVPLAVQATLYPLEHSSIEYTISREGL